MIISINTKKAFDTPNVHSWHFYVFVYSSSYAQSSSHVWLCVTLWTLARQVPLPMEFSRQEYWRACPFHSRASSWPRDQTCISCNSCIGRWILYLLTHVFDSYSINPCWLNKLKCSIKPQKWEEDKQL